MKRCMGADDAVLSSPAWRYRMLHVAHRTATDTLLEKELSKRLRISPASVTAALKALEKQGCIVREAQESDMRRKRIRITDKGREVALRYKEVFTEVDEAMYRGFSDEELRAVSAYFERITQNLRALCEQEDGQC